MQSEIILVMSVEKARFIFGWKAESSIAVIQYYTASWSVRVQE